MRRTIPCTSKMSGTQSSLDAGAVEDSARYLFDGDFRGVEHRNAVPLEHRLRGPDFESHLLCRRVAAVGTALIANLLQPVRLDGQAEQFPRMRFERRRQASRFQIVLGQRKICGEYSVLRR